MIGLFNKVRLASLFSLFAYGIAQAADTPVAAQAAAPHQGSPWSMLWLPAVLILIFYFLMIRPQTKRAKQQRQLLEGIGVGDEVVTSGGMIGRVARLRDNFVVLEVFRGTEVMFQKNAIASILPKGTMDSV
jgi:preprotein translocase subunit YajC